MSSVLKPKCNGVKLTEEEGAPWEDGDQEAFSGGWASKLGRVITGSQELDLHRSGRLWGVVGFYSEPG